ncbi:DNA mismatch repair protein msh6 [Thecamonas trahens ATCC 50062]|uniref:DNA mismatch repair protein n=1 Tax=Thecamonas trahens ATCC 50062 TaxID=461836 RepID=A0A0L0DIW6_THETB|nr:DNA mismatch repair protein msh6 [Thecamonas trahens ATCC 50062]KNC52130.1 DNA mismatch repair protein msh6 [Thecamonas trahens ATCC 50062]|eukprot:XP_013762134.1 DNA mismatch repair protein msh6 [Thecamonas trahens ATCC 50062]
MVASSTGSGGTGRVVAGRPSRKRKIVSYRIDDDDDDDDSGASDDGSFSDSVATKHPASKKARRRRVVDSDSDDSDDEEFVLDPAELAADEEEEAEADAAMLADPETLKGLEEAAAASPEPVDEASSDDLPLSAMVPMDVVPVRKSSSASSSAWGGLSTKAAKRAERKTKFAAANKDRFAFLVDVRDGAQRRPSHPDYDPSTLYIPPKYFDAKSKLFTGFEKQYWAIKKDYFDTVVFFKKGKFYEVFEGDADITHQVLDLKLTERVNMRMCGVPEMHFQKWAAQLVALGYKVARVDQVETKIGSDLARKDGSKAKGANLIRRKLTQVLTAGTLVEDELLASPDAAYLLAIAEVPAHGSGSGAPATSHTLGVAFVDCATGKFYATQLNDNEHLTLLETLLVQIKPKEVLLARGETSKPVAALVKVHVPRRDALVLLDAERQFWDASARASWLAASVEEVPAELTALLDGPAERSSALGALFYYLDKLKLGPSLVAQGVFAEYDIVKSSTSLVMDGQTLYNLNVLNNSHDGSTRGTLLELTQFCVTPFGRRRFRHELAYPLVKVEDIRARQAAVEVLRSTDEHLAAPLEGMLKSLPDLERLTSRAAAKACPMHKFVALLQAFETVSTFMASTFGTPGTPGAAAAASSPLLTSLLSVGVDDLAAGVAHFRAAFDWEAALQQGSISPRPGVHALFDELNAEIKSINSKLESHLKEVRSSLRVSGVEYKHLNKEAYQIQVPASTTVPANWILRSQTKAVKRYWSPFLAELLPHRDEVLERFAQTQVVLLKHFLGEFEARQAVWRRAIDKLAALDVLISLKTFSRALAEPKCLPTVTAHEAGASSVPQLAISELRHPCVKVSIASSFIPNDVVVGGDGPGVILLTGPNMGGKSTLLRSVAVAVILAQMGAYVPAAVMTLAPVDRIFTRIGAHDHIMRGQSTFMVELLETAAVLQHGTASSLVIMDELGRGTSTFDGYSIAYAVLSELLNGLGARTLFSTHYHALCEEFSTTPGVSLQHMSCYVDEEADEVTFLYKLAPGVASKSYGMNVAKLAGVADSIVARATELAQDFESSSPMYHFRAEYSSLTADQRQLFKQLAAALAPAAAAPSH